MKRKTILFIATLIIIGVAGAWYFLGKTPAAAPTQGTVQEPEPSLDPTKHGYFDVSTAKQMIIYNQQAIELSDIAQHGETDADIQKLAEKVATAHNNAAEQYAKWLNDWNEPYLSLSDFPREDGHDAYPTNPGMPKVAELDKATTMSTADKEKEFLRLLLQLYEGTLEYIDMRSDQIQYGEMKKYAVAEKTYYEQEIQSIKNLQKAKGYN